MFIENSEELAQNKLLLLYIIDKAEKPLTNENITDFVLEEDYMNYFLIQQYLSELTKTNFVEYITKGEKEVYILLSKGESTLSYFEDRISEKTKKEITSHFVKIKKDQSIATQVIGKYFKKDDNEYIVSLKLLENNETLFSLYLDVATVKQAETICHTWKENTEYIYKNLLNMLIDDKI